MTWPMIFLLVVLKIPVAYLGYVVWWAIKAEPLPDEPSEPVAVVGVDPGPSWQPRLRPDRFRGPVRRPPRRRAVVAARAGR